MRRVAGSIIVLLAALLLMVASGVAQAQLASPHPASATAPADPALPWASLRATPLGTMAAYAQAMSLGKADELRNCLHAGTADGQELVDAYVHLAVAMTTLREAAIAEYGPDGFAQVGFADQYAEQVERLKGAREEIDQGEATVYVPAPGSKGAWAGSRPAESAVYLVQADRQWKIDVERSFRNPQRQAVRIDAQAGAYEDLAQEIAAQKHPLAIKARMAGREKVEAAKRKAEAELAQQQNPATRPVAGN